MRYGFARLQLDGLVSQQAQTPPGIPCGRSGASERRNLGALCAVDADGSPTACLVKEGRLQAFAQVTALDVKDGLERDLQGGRDIYRVSAAMKEIEDTSARLRSG